MTEAVIAVLHFLTRFHFVLIAAELVGCVGTPVRKLFWLRFVPLVALYLVFANMLLDVSSVIAVGWLSFAFFIIFAWSVAIVFCCFRLSMIRTLFVGLSGYVFQNMFFEIKGIVNASMSADALALWRYLINFTVMCVMLAVFRLVFVRHIRKVDESPRRLHYTIIYSALVLAVVYVLHSYASYAGELSLSLRILLILFNFVLLVVQFDMLARSKLQKDNETIERMLVVSAQQRSVSEENIAVINRKCHDLKYQIAAIRESGSADIADELRELENAVGIYEHTANTGNKTLDAVLTEKKFVCGRNGIKFNYIADTAKLGCIASVVDLYSLFGNLIDNMIDGVKNLPEEERIITLNVGSFGNMLRIHADNRCDAEPEFEDGLPKTSKDERYHGFGVKSIRYIAEKYGGNAVMRVENRRFVTDILIPFSD